MKMNGKDEVQGGKNKKMMVVSEKGNKRFILPISDELISILKSIKRRRVVFFFSLVTTRILLKKIYNSKVVVYNCKL